jgi:hypothetical protein
MRSVLTAVWAGVVCVALLVASAGAVRADEPVPVAPQVETPAPAGDPAEVDARFQQAVADFAAGRFAEAAAGFDAVAAASVDPGQRATAIEMARQARARMVAPPPGGMVSPYAPNPPAPLPANDAKLDAQSRDGRYMLLVGTTLIGLSLYGPSLVAVSNSEGKTAVGLYMLGAGASFFVPYVLTRDEPVTWAMTDAWWYGGTRGALHGLLALDVADSDPDSDASLTAASIGSLVEGTGFTVWAKLTDATPGLTNVMGKGADFGAAVSLGVASIIMPDSAWDENAASASALIGAGAGFVLGNVYGHARDMTWGDGEVLRATGLLGAYAAALPLIYGEADDRRVIAGTLVAGGLAGLYLGDRLLDGHDFSAGQGIVVELSTYAGALAGAGLGYLVSPDDNDTAEAKIIATGVILGAIGGFTASYMGLDTEARRPDPKAPPGVALHIAPDLTADRKGIVVAGSF